MPTTSVQTVVPLSEEQQAYAQALANIGDAGPHLACDVARLASATGTVAASARQYASKVMQDLRLCIAMLDGQDLTSIARSPSAIVDILCREAKPALALR